MSRHAIDTLARFTKQLRQHPSIPDRATLERHVLFKTSAFTTPTAVRAAPAAGENVAIVWIHLFAARDDYGVGRLYTVGASGAARWYISYGGDAESLSIDQSRAPILITDAINFAQIVGYTTASGGYLGAEVYTFEWND